MRMVFSISSLRAFHKLCILAWLQIAYCLLPRSDRWCACAANVSYHWMFIINTINQFLNISILLMANYVDRSVHDQLSTVLMLIQANFRIADNARKSRRATADFATYWFINRLFISCWLPKRFSESAFGQLSIHLGFAAALSTHHIIDLSIG